MPRFIRLIAAILVLVGLTTGAAQALPARPAVVPEAGSLLAAAWDWLVSRIRPVEPPPPRRNDTGQQKYGCGIDPDGKPKPCEN